MSPSDLSPPHLSPSHRIGYVPSVQDGLASAKFHDGSVVSIASGRARRFPNLPSPAPDTLPLYRLALDSLRQRASCSRVLDVGCGSGTGADLLSARFDQVLGVDLDSGALSFARKCYPACTFLHSPIESLTDLQPVDLVFVVDVLGQVLSPLSVLNHLRGLLAPGASVFLAEAIAFPSQCLLWPTRRAFSRRALARTVGAAGFHVDAWLVEDGTYLGCLLSKGQDCACHHLVVGANAQAAGDAEQALSHFQKAADGENQDVAIEGILAEAELRGLCGDGDGAVAAYLRAAQSSHLDPRAKAGLAQISCGIGEYADALALADLALRMDPTDVSSACSRALALEHVAPSQALGAWRLALGLAPDNPQIAVRLSMVARTKAEKLLALWALTRVQKYDEPEFVEFFVALIETLRALGRHVDAATELSLARKRFPSAGPLDIL